MSRYLTRQFWVDQFDPAVRSAAQGFLTGAGIGSTAGDFAVFSWGSVGAGLVGAASMAVLSVVFALAAGPTNGGAPAVRELSPAENDSVDADIDEDADDGKPHGDRTVGEPDLDDFPPG